MSEAERIRSVLGALEAERLECERAAKGRHGDLETLNCLKQVLKDQSGTEHEKETRHVQEMLKKSEEELSNFQSKVREKVDLEGATKELTRVSAEYSAVQALLQKTPASVEMNALREVHSSVQAAIEQSESGPQQQELAQKALQKEVALQSHLGSKEAVQAVAEIQGVEELQVPDERLWLEKQLQALEHMKNARERMEKLLAPF